MKNRTLHYLIRFLVGEDAPSEIVESIGYTNDSNRFDKYNVVIIPSGFFDEHIYGTPASNFRFVRCRASRCFSAPRRRNG